MRWILALALAVAVCAQPAPRRISPAGDIAVQRKIALLIGNAAYSSQPLRNPPRDVRAMAGALRRLGFTVTTAFDLNRRQMNDATGRFASELRAGDLALFYYSGHGVQLNQENYLIPVDFEAVSASDLQYNAFPAAQVRDRLEDSGARVRVLILDACRDNPFRAVRGGSRGLAAMNSHAEGTLIAYATADNSTSDDNPGEANGLYTKYLLAALDHSELTLKQVFEQTRDNVYLNSGKRQRPYTYDGIVGDVALWNSRAVTGTATLAPDAEAWEAVRASNDRRVFEQFLKEFPNSQFAGTARVKLAAMNPTREPPAALPAPVQTAARRTKVNPKDGLTYVWIPAGTFMMGCSPGDEQCSANEKPPHKVVVTKGFWMGQTEVTIRAWGQFEEATNPSFRFLRSNPQLNLDGAMFSMNWQQAVEYCTWAEMRLPTEAEWEYAARAGSTSPRYGDPKSIAIYSDNLRGAGLSGPLMGYPVKRLSANAWGLYDMLGNMMELVADRYATYPLDGGDQQDPTGPSSGNEHVLRGGNSDSSESNIRASVRLAGKGFIVKTGFRCASN